MIHATDTEGSRALSMAWCQVGLHRLFELAGEASTGKLERQLVTYYLMAENLSAAHQILDEMSFIQRNNKYSRYLAYCVALRKGEDAETQSLLNTVTNGQGDDDQLLYACIGESVKYGKPLDRARLLQRIVDKQVQASTGGNDLGALLKYTVETLMEVIDMQDKDQHLDQEILLRLCAVFKHAARLQDRKKYVDRRFTIGIDEYWFEERSFELARIHVKTWPTRYIIDLLHYSSQLCTAQAGSIPEATLSEARRTRLQDSIFMQAILYASEARNATKSYTVQDLPQTSFDSKFKPKTSECRVILYRQVFKVFTTLHEQYQSQPLNKSDNLEDIQGQLQILVPVAFEALMFMNASAYSCEDNAFDEVSIRQFLGTANELRVPATTYAYLADIVLAFATGDATSSPQLDGLHIPSLSAARIVGQIIQTLRQVEAYNTEQAARWIRCITQLIMEDVEKNMPKIVLQETPKQNSALAMLDSVVQQAIEMAGSCAERAMGIGARGDSGGDVDTMSEQSDFYPPEELEWLATKLFNMAIDFCAAKQQARAERMACKAVEVAGLLGTDSGLAVLLKRNFNELGWNTTS